MKILCKNILLTTAVVCLSCMLSTGVSAKVCFVGDPNCGSGGSFNDYEDQGENACLGVVDENGKQIYQKGPCGNGMQVTAYCPYDSSYVQCCGKEYVYNTPCVYPLVSKGKCGNKYKCECDTSTYKYTDNECKTVKGSAGDGYENSYASGPSCTQMRYDSGSGEIVSEVKYTSCQCDRGLYPKLGFVVPEPEEFQSDCDFNAEKTGPCSTKYANSNRTETYYKFCRCNTQDYPKTDSGCYPLTGDGDSGTCFDTIMHYQKCATCTGFPARNLDHVAYPGKEAKLCERDQKGELVDSNCNYEVCPHDQSSSSYFKIHRCDEPGYEVNSDGSACVKISCSKAVSQFITENTDYGIFDGKYLRDADGNVSKSARYGIVTGNISLTSSKTCGETITHYKTVCTSGKCVYSFDQFCKAYVENQTGIICGNGGIGIMSNGVNPKAPIKPTSTFCCTGTRDIPTGTSIVGQGALGCASATSYYSPQYVVYNRGATSSDGARAMNVACETAPKISSSNALNGTSSTVYTYGVNWDIYGSIDKPLVINNGGVYFSNATVNASTKLTKSNSYPNSTATKATGSLTVKSEYKSQGYDYDLNKLAVNNTSGKVVYFWGNNSSDRNTIRIRSQFTMGGIAGMKDVDVYSANTYIGCPGGGTGCGYDKDNPGYDNSGISLYNTNWYLWEGTSTSYNLYMQSRSYLGYPTGQYLEDWGNYSNKIIGRNFTWYYTSVNDVHYNAEDSDWCSRTTGPLKYINSGGSVGSISFSGDGHRILCVGNGHSSSCGARYVVWKGTGTHSESVNGGNCDAKRCLFCAGVL